MAEKIDRRIVRTRALLKEALLALILDKGYDALRVEDITERANLRRATFYLHYKDRDDLLFTVLEETFQQLAAETLAHARPDALAGKTHVDAFLATFRHAEQNHALYRTLLSGQVGAAVAKRIRDYIAGLVLSALREAALPALVPLEVLAQSIAAVELALIQWWLDNERPYPAAEIAAYAHRLALTGVLGALLPTTRTALLALTDPPLH